MIYAVDKGEASLADIPDRYQQVTIYKEIVDMNKNDLTLPALDDLSLRNKQRDAVLLPNINLTK